MKYLLKFIFVIPILLILFACEENPSSVGDNLLESQDLTSLHSLNSDESAIFKSFNSYIDTISLGSSKRNLIGKYQNVSSTGLIKFSFSLTDSMTEALKNNQITPVSASLVIRPVYNLGDSNLTPQFKFYKITSKWTSTKFGLDDLSSIAYDNGNQLNESLSITDTTFSFGLKTDVVFDWLKATVDTAAYKNYGTIILPDENTERLIGFVALNSYATLEELPQLSFVVRVNGSKLDTISGIPTIDAFAASGNMPEVAADNFVVQGGIPVRSNIHLDLSAIPKNAIIISAAFSVNLDADRTVFGSSDSDSLVLSMLKDDVDNLIDTKVPQLVIKKDSTNQYSGDIRRLIQYWVDQKENLGMQIKLSDEDRAVSKVAIFNDKAAEDTLKPRLKIIYTDIK